MSKSIKTVAIVSDISGGCQYVAIVKNVDLSEYAKLLSEQRQHEQKKERRIKQLENDLFLISEEAGKLIKEIKVLKGEDEDEESIED